MREDTIVTFTGRSPQQILEEGGNQAWELDLDRASMCKYSVCVQNKNTRIKEFRPTEPHRTAFMVGRIFSIEPADEQPEPHNRRRYIIKFSEYARINLP